MKKLVLLFPAVLMLGCVPHQDMGPSASAVLEPRSGSSARGMVRFAELADGSVRVTLDATGVPAGNRGFHVHQNGDCSAPDATSAGPHFDSGGNPHGAPGNPPHHSGDFGNVLATSDGLVRRQFTTRAITVSPGPSSVVGRAVIIHGGTDDLTSQPAGDAGARIACGVVSDDA